MPDAPGASDDEIAELRRRLAEAEAAAEWRSRLVGHVSHEFRTPLSSIIGFASLLASEHHTMPEALRDEYLDVVLRNARHLLHVVNDILNLSKVQAGTLEVTLAPLRAGEVAAAVATSMRPSAAERGITLTVADEARHLAVADVGRLRQVLLNLVDNAVKYSPPGARVEVRVESGGGEVRCAVADDGPGVGADDQARLFREFSRINNGLRVSGAGLGLALAKQLTEAMGGRIGVDSAAGRGSVFWVALPAGETVESGAEPMADAGGAGSGRGVVAVVDDDDDIRAFVSIVLEMAGYAPLPDDGAEGVAARLAPMHPVLVLLDLNLDGRDGAQVLAELRARPELASVPVAAFTAAAGPRDVERVRAAGFDAHVVKPVEPDVLLARAEALIAAAAERRRGAEGRVSDPEHVLPEAEEEDYLAELRARFVAGLPRRLEAMRDAVGGGDGEALAREAHKLKGAAAGYGIEALSVLAAAAEEALRSGAGAAHPAVRTLLERLERDAWG